MPSDFPASHPARHLGGRWRYRLVVALIWCAVLAAAAAGWRYARTSGPAFGPLVIVSVEGLRADHLPAYGYTKVHTPAIDALVADSVVFDRAYAHSALTLPSHVSLLSGLLPFQSGVRDEIGFAVRDDLPLVPRLLHKRGFKTGGMVSSYLLRKETGLGAAFGFYDDELAAETGSGGVAAARDGAGTLKVAEHWIDSIGTGRFFLFLHLEGPSDAALSKQAGRLSPYDARVAYADELVAELVAFLKKRGLYSGGVLVLTSDHGEALGDHGEQGHGLFAYEPVIHVPLIVKSPRRDGGGRHSSALVQHIDIAPTLLDMVGAPRPSGLKGRSLRGVLDSPTGTLPLRQVYSEALGGYYRFGWAPVQSLTGDRYRYVRAARPELYDVLQDPRERADLVETNAAEAETLRAALEKLAGAQAAVPVPAVATPLPAAAAAAPEAAPASSQAGPAASQAGAATPQAASAGVPPAIDPAEVERERLAALGFVPVPVLQAEPGPTEGGEGRVADARASNKYWEGIGLAGRGDTAGAIAALREAVGGDPQMAAAWDRLTALLLQADRPKEAGDTLTSLLLLYPEAERLTEAERRLRSFLAGTPSADRYLAAVAVWQALGEKDRAAELRSAARKAVGEAALRKAEAATRKPR